MNPDFLVALVTGILAGSSSSDTPLPAVSNPAVGPVTCAGPSCAGKLPPPSLVGKLNYYISISGSTSNSGTNRNSPWPPSRLNDIPGGSVVNFACDQSFGSITLSVPGATNAPTIYQTDPFCGSNRAQFTNIIISADWITVYNIKVNASGHGITVSNGVSYVTVQGSEVAGGSGVYVGTVINNGGTHVTIDSTEVHGSYDSGVFLYHHRSLVKYNKFYDNGGGLGYGYHHIYMKSDRSVFRNNDFGALNTSIDPANAGNAISMRFTNERVYGNYFHDIDEPLDWFQESSERGTARIYYNRFQNVNSLLYVDVNASVYQGAPSLDIIFANNTIQGSGGTLFNIWRNTGSAVFKNNLSIGRWSTVVNGTHTESNNLWNSATGVGPAPEFALSNGSNAIDAGTAEIPGLTYRRGCNGRPLGYCGSAPDIGFNESVSP